MSFNQMSFIFGVLVAAATLVLFIALAVMLAG